MFFNYISCAYISFNALKLIVKILAENDWVSSFLLKGGDTNVLVGFPEFVQ